MKNNTHKIIRHGDVNMHEVSEAIGEIISHNGVFTVELGETTGHMHKIAVKNPADMTIKKDALGNYYFELSSEATLTHEEHKTITIMPGIYKKVKEREVDHFTQTVRKVID